MGTTGKALATAVLIILAIPLGWVGSAWIYEGLSTYKHRYRLTIEVETGAGVKSSASVIEVSIREKASWVPQTGGVTASARGEAMFLDLGGGRNVIATLGFGPQGQEHKIEWLATETIGPLHPDAKVRIGGRIWQEASSWTGHADLPPALIPTLVTFSDINDSASARVVQPEEFERVFGPDVRFKRAWVEMTSDPVTTGIEKKFPWWNGPFPWEQPMGGGVFADTRRDGFRWTKEHFKRGN